MASKMATSYAPKTYLTYKLNKKQFNFDFLCMFRGLMMETIKINIGLVQKVEIDNMVSKMAAILKQNST